MPNSQPTVPELKNMFDAGRMVYTPQQTAFYGTEMIRAVQAGKYRSLIFPIEGMRDYVAPLMPFETMVFIAQPSQAKSTMLDFFEMVAAQQLIAQERFDECIIHVSVEETIEAMAFRGFSKIGGENTGNMARGTVKNFDNILMSSTKLASIPIFRIGESSMREDSFKGPLTLSNIERGIKKLVGGDITGDVVKPAGIFVDYLQALPLDPEMRKANIEVQRRLQVRDDVYRLQDWPKIFNCPVVYAAQAKQNMECGTGEWQLPGWKDGEETNAIPQRVDRIITQWLVKQTSPVGARITHGDISFTVEEDMIFFKAAKQRGGLPAGRTFPCRINYNAGTIATDPSITAKKSGNVWNHINE